MDGIGAWFKDNIVKGSDKFSQDALQKLMEAGIINQEIYNSLSELTKGKGLLGIVTTGLISVVFLLSYASTYVHAVQNVQSQNVAKETRTEIPGLTEIMGAAFIDPNSVKPVREIGRKLGLSESLIDLIFKSSYNLYDENTVRSLYLRGEIDLDKVYIRMRELRYTDTRIAEMIKCWNYIPGVPDLIMMAVKEAFNEEQARALDLDAEFPGDILKWTRAQGLDDDFAKKYWRSHWELPSPQMGFEMLHRRIIDKAQLFNLLKALDYAPVWREKLLEISYNVMTRVDVRRMYELGLIDDDKLLAIHEAMGYSPDDSKLLAQWVKIEYAQDLKDLTAGKVIKQYLDGFATESEAEDLLKRMGYLDSRINQMIASAQYDRGYAKQTERITAFKKLYVAGQMGQEQVRNELGEFNIDPRKITELLETWEIDKLAGIKLPRFQELTAWLADDIINETEFSDEMTRLGYKPKYIQWYYRAAQKKKEG